MIIKHTKILSSRKSGLVLTFSLVSSCVFSVCGLMYTQHAVADTIDWLSPAITAVADNSKSTQNTGSSTVYPCVNRQVTVGTVVVGSGNISGTACVFEAESFRFGGMRYCWPNTYSPGCTDHYFMLIGFGEDPRMYVVQNMHDSMYNLCWQVIPSTDDLIDACNGFIGIVKDLPNHLTSVTGGTGPEYIYDQSATHQFQDDTGYYPRIYASNMSPNGKWIVAEISGYGLARIRVSDYSIKLFQIGTASYGLGRDPSYNFSITNDGRFVSVSGGNLGANIYDLSGDCGITTGVILSAWNSSGSHTDFTSCSSRDIAQTLIDSDGGVGAGFRSFTNTRFSDDGGQLEGIFTPYQYVNGGMTTWITLTAANYVPPLHLEYLALGDSYSSGEGDIAEGESHYLYNKNLCHLSDRSYPYLLRDYWGISPMSMESVACSGAKVLPDYIGSGDYYGQHKEMKGWSASRMADAQSATLTLFTPGIMRQIEFVKRYKPEKVTFTGGGNDVGFASILEYCAASYRLFNFIPLDESCAFASNSQMRANLNKTIDDQYKTNKLLVQKIREASPETKIYMIGYPQFVAVEGISCANDSVILDKAERQMIHDSVSRLNNVLKKVAHDTGVYYVDIENSLDGGEICQGSEYMTGPLKMIALNQSFGEDPNMFHPNAAGHEKIAEAIERQFTTAMDYTILDIPDEQNGMRTVQMAVMPNYSGIGSTSTITMDPGVFKPDGEVTIELFSQPLNLGTTHIADDGTLSAIITLPKGVEPGHHLLTITGTDIDGNPVQVQQFITVISDTPNDIDGDGIPDAGDTCNFIAEWYIDNKNICLPPAASDNKSTDSVNRMPSRTESPLLSSQANVLQDSFGDQTTQSPLVKQLTGPTSKATMAKTENNQLLIYSSIIAIIVLMAGYIAIIKRKNKHA